MYNILMPNMPSAMGAADSSMPRTRGPVSTPTATSSQRAPRLMGQDVSLSIPAPNRPTSIPEQVMMEAMMRRMGAY